MTASSPWPEEEAPTGIPSDYKCTAAESPTACPVEEDHPNHLGVRQDAGETYEDMNTTSNEHFVQTYVMIVM